MEKAMQNQKGKAKQEPDGARLLARTVKSGLPLKGSQADALEVERWRQTFAVKCAPGGTDWSISKELFSKACFAGWQLGYSMLPEITGGCVRYRF